MPTMRPVEVELTASPSPTSSPILYDKEEIENTDDFEDPMGTSHNELSSELLFLNKSTEVNNNSGDLVVDLHETVDVHDMDDNDCQNRTQPSNLPTHDQTVVSNRNALHQLSSSSTCTSDRKGGGPNETLYNDQNYDTYIDFLISDYKNKCSDKPLRDFRTMNESERSAEMERVNSLLQRLGILGQGDTEILKLAHCKYGKGRKDEASAVQRIECTLLGATGKVEDTSSCCSSPTRMDDTDSNLLRNNNDDQCSDSDDENDIPSDQLESARQDLSKILLDSPSSESKMNAHDSHCSSIELVRKDRTSPSAHNCSLSLLSPSSFQSPLLQRKEKKRLATTSGKRGMDLQRVRTSYEDSEDGSIDFGVPDHSSGDGYGYANPDSVDDIESPSQLYCPSIESPRVAFQRRNEGFESAEERKRTSPFFLDGASQSPISRHDSVILLDSARSHQTGRSIFFHESPQRDDGGLKTPARKYSDDTIESVNCTVLPRRARFRATQDETSHDYSDEAPLPVRLKDGALYHLDSLRVRRPSRRSKSAEYKKDVRLWNIVHPGNKGSGDNQRPASATSLPDPFEQLSSRLAQRLSIALEWITERDVHSTVSCSEQANTASTGRGVVLFMSIRHIICVCLRLFLAHGVHKNRGKANALVKAPLRLQTLSGGTLLVVRGRNDTKEWECALREGMSITVLNHAEMPSTERRRVSTAAKCAGFDIVLTTFDAIKAKEIAISIDKNGYAITKTASQDGWYSSRSGVGSDSENQSRPCEVLCVLHSIKWFRIIFVDELGSKSYLTKPGTARSKAATAMNSKSRFIFFCKSPGHTGYLENKLKESRRQLCPLACALHLPQDRAGEDVVGTAMLDFRDIKENVDESCIDESRVLHDSSGDVMSSETECDYQKRETLVHELVHRYR